MLAADESGPISSSRRIRTRLVEFFATLDLGAELAETMRSSEVPQFLRRVFGPGDGLKEAAAKFSNLRGRFADRVDLVGLVDKLLKEEPRNFLVLSHLH